MGAQQRNLTGTIAPYHYGSCALILRHFPNTIAAPSPIPSRHPPQYHRGTLPNTIAAPSPIPNRQNRYLDGAKHRHFFLYFQLFGLFFCGIRWDLRNFSYLCTMFLRRHDILFAQISHPNYHLELRELRAKPNNRWSCTFKVQTSP